MMFGDPSVSDFDHTKINNSFYLYNYNRYRAWTAQAIYTVFHFKLILLGLISNHIISLVIRRGHKGPCPDMMALLPPVFMVL